MNFQEFYLINDEDYLLEYTRIDMRNINAASVIRRRSNNFRPDRLLVKLVEFNKPYNVLVYETFSQTHPYDNGIPGDQSRVKWTQRIRLTKLMELNVALKNDKSALLEKVNEAVDGDIQVQCDCPSFRYWGYRYFLNRANPKAAIGMTSTDIGFDRRFINRAPISERNQGGITCKHIDAVLRVMPFHRNEIRDKIQAVL